MYKVGVYFGKFLPPHRGHLMQIISAATQCETLYVVISDNRKSTFHMSLDSGVDVMTARLRKQWISQEVQDMENIKVTILDETNIPIYPNGWLEWTNLMKELIPQKIDVFFCGEYIYKEELPKYFKGIEVILFDPDRTRFPICATDIRDNPLGNWDYIIGPARPHFAKKVLIVGTESTGKTTLTKYLAKIYHTSWSEEVGREYAKKFLGGDESIFMDSDFSRIAALQHEQDLKAIRNCNKVCFIDTDAVITNYYSLLYLGHQNPLVEQYVDCRKYDLVLYLLPDVKWVDDGMRLNGKEKIREELNNNLIREFQCNGFNLNFIGGTYLERLEKAIVLVDNLLEDKI